MPRASAATSPEIIIKTIDRNIELSKVEPLTNPQRNVIAGTVMGFIDMRYKDGHHDSLEQIIEGLKHIHEQTILTPTDVEGDVPVDDGKKIILDS